MSVTERLLQFIWQFQYFNKSELLSTSGEVVHVIHPGQYNTNQGPDFLNARIVIGKTVWAGTVELHIKSSDWYRHKHQDDKNYHNVILHVVWEDDDTSLLAKTKLAALTPLLELQNRVAKVLLQRYEELMHSTAFIPCGRGIESISDISWQSWKERLLAERLMRKAAVIRACLEENNFHWEETFWWLLARNFGMKVNAETFEAIARSIPLTVLAKHRNHIHQLEALLAGQAGLLDRNFTEHYPILLEKEYRFLQKKYQLQPVKLPVFSLRMRPGNFPAVRLAELAMLIHQSGNLFSRVRESESAGQVSKLFEVTANDYWHYHYQFDETSTFKKKNTGSFTLDNITINTVVPILFAFGEYHNEAIYKNKAIQFLEETAPDQNNITKGFMKLGLDIKNARDSQALIELKNEYCSCHRCLDCAVGNSILKTQRYQG